MAATDTTLPPTATGPIVRDRLYIGGEWIEPDGRDTVDVVNSSTEEVMGTVPLGSPADIDRAVAAAREAFPAWSQTSPEERADVLDAVTNGLRERSEEIAVLIAGEVGMPLQLSVMIQAGLPTMSFASMAQLAREFAWEEEEGNSLIVREPVGWWAASHRGTTRCTR